MEYFAISCSILKPRAVTLRFREPSVFVTIGPILMQCSCGQQFKDPVVFSTLAVCLFICKQLRMISDCCAASGLTKSFLHWQGGIQKIPPIFLLCGYDAKYNVRQGHRVATTISLESKTALTSKFLTSKVRSWDLGTLKFWDLRSWDPKTSRPEARS